MPVGFGAAIRESIVLNTPNGLPGLLNLSLPKKQNSGMSQSNLGKKLRSKKEIHDIIECNSSNFNTVVNCGENEISDILNGEGGQKNQKTYLNELYNQDIAPEDSEKTLFYYLKTLVISVTNSGLRDHYRAAVLCGNHILVYHVLRLHSRVFGH